jgi:hypothetical protein
MRKNKKSGLSWWRELFLNHPGFASKDPSAFAKSGTGATTVSKVYCRLCFPVDVNRAMEEDIRAIAEGRINEVRSEAQIQSDCESNI